MCRLKDLRYFMLRFLRMWMSKWKQPMTVFVSEFCWESLDEISKMLIFLITGRGRGFFFKILTEIKCSGLHLIPTIYRLTREMGYNWRKIQFFTFKQPKKNQTKLNYGLNLGIGSLSCQYGGGSITKWTGSSRKSAHLRHLLVWSWDKTQGLWPSRLTSKRSLIQHWGTGILAMRNSCHMAIGICPSTYKCRKSRADTPNRLANLARRKRISRLCISMSLRCSRGIVRRRRWTSIRKMSSVQFADDDREWRHVRRTRDERQ